MLKFGLNSRDHYTTPLLYASLAEIFPDRKRKDFDPGQQDRSHLFLRVS